MGHSSEIWLDRFADRVGFGKLSDRLPPSYVYALTTIVSYRLLVLGYALSRGMPLYNTENPYFLLQPIVLLGAVYGARSLTQSYDSAMREMRIQKRADDPEQFSEIVPTRLPLLLFAVGAAIQLVRAFIALPEYGFLDIVANFVVFPFVYTPIVVQFFAVYIGIQVIAPRRLANSEVGIHFYDPHGVGGLRPLGELLKRSYYYVVVGLIVYTLITYAPFISTDWSVVPFAGVVFTGIWLLTVGSVGFGVHQLHRFLHREKRAKIQRLERQLEDLIDDPWSVEHTVPEEKRDRVEDIRQRMSRVSATREYPATFSIWSQLLLGVAIPKAVQLFVAAA